MLCCESFGWISLRCCLLPHTLFSLRIGCVLHARIALLRLLSRRFAELLSPSLLLVLWKARMIAHSQSLRFIPPLLPHIQLHSQRTQISLLRERQAASFDVRHHTQRLIHIPHATQCQYHFTIRLWSRHQSLQLHLTKQLRCVGDSFGLCEHGDEQMIRHAIGFLAEALRVKRSNAEPASMELNTDLVRLKKRHFE